MTPLQLAKFLASVESRKRAWRRLATDNNHVDPFWNFLERFAEY